MVDTDKPKPRLVLRADGNGRIGLGHVMRPLALAEILRTVILRSGFFLFKRPPLIVRLVIQRAGLEAVELLGELTNEELARSLLRPTDVLVLDGYGFDYAYQVGRAPAGGAPGVPR
ncbi:MAG: hypothetical protein WKG07_43260 [Hymenobacter sp.]